MIKHEPGQRYLLTGPLNQDPGENVFSMARNNRGSYEHNPSAARMMRNLKLIMFQNLDPSNNSGYSNAQSENLLEYPETSDINSEGAEFDVDIGINVNDIVSLEIDFNEEQTANNEEGDVEAEKSVTESKNQLLSLKYVKNQLKI